MSVPAAENVRQIKDEYGKISRAFPCSKSYSDREREIENFSLDEQNLSGFPMIGSDDTKYSK